MANKFQIGQVVEYRPPRGIDAPRGPYLVAALLPERDGEFYYHLRHPGEVHVRIAGERRIELCERGNRDVGDHHLQRILAANPAMI
jgi:hypothetical protein